MKLSDFRKLKLLMNMTLSGADQERLTAIDKANEIVRRSDTTWDRILDRVITIENQIESVEAATSFARDGSPSAVAARKAAYAKRVEEAFSVIEDTDPRGDFADFIASLKSQWDSKGRLSEAQAEALFKSAKRAEERR